jgi:hypothetical protein
MSSPIATPTMARGLNESVCPRTGDATKRSSLVLCLDESPPSSPRFDDEAERQPPKLNKRKSPVSRLSGGCLDPSVARRLNFDDE